MSDKTKYCKCCQNTPGSMLYALENIVWYDGHYIWLKELRDELVKQPKDEFYCSYLDVDECHTEKHAIWMILVGMFGDWGTSIRSGWIEDIDGCIEFINNLCEESWRADGERTN